MTTTQLKPVGQRPKCLHCGKELRPNFNRPRPPLLVGTGEMHTYNETVNYSTGATQERTFEITRGLTDAEKKQWRKEHPPEFKGTYGSFDNRFCGLNCGYCWAVAHTHKQV